MRKLMLIALVVGGMTQAYAEGQFGLETGVNIANNSVKLAGADVTQSSKTGWVGGVFYEMPMIDWLSLQPELLVVGKGSKGTVSTVTTSLTYLAIPILLKAKIATGSIVTPYALFGPEVSFLIGKSNSNNSAIADNTYKSLDLGLDMGAGVDFDVSPTIKVGASLRYNLGLTNEFGTTVTAGDATASAKNKGLYVLGSVSFAM